MPIGGGIPLRCEQIQSRIPRRAVGVVAVGAVDLEPGSSPGFERAAVGVVPDRQSRSLGRGRSSGKGPQAGPVLELVLDSRRVREVAVQVPGLGADRRHGLARLVASLALVGIGDDVVIRSRLAVAMDPLDVLRSAGKLESGLGLLCVPDVGQADPSVGFSFQNPRLDQPPTLGRIARIARIGERLGDHGADGKVEGVAVAVGRMRSRRQLEESILQGVVAEERRVQIVGNDALGRLLRCAVADEEAVLREPFRGRLRCRLDGLRTFRAAAGQGHDEEYAESSCP